MPAPARYLLAHPGTLPVQCTTYLLVGPEGPVLIDPGTTAGDEELLQRLAGFGYAPEEIPWILLTHYHADHAHTAHLWQERGARLASSAYTASIMRSRNREIWADWLLPVQPIEMDREYADGEVLHLGGLDILALPTPGHTLGCTSFLVETQDGLTAFTGDLLTTDCHPGWAGSPGFSVEESIASLEKLLAAAPQRIGWGHEVIEEPAEDWLRRGIAMGKAGEWLIEPDLPRDPESTAKMLPRP